MNRVNKAVTLLGVQICTAKIIIPDKVVFVFNPIFLEVQLSDTALSYNGSVSVTVDGETRSVRIAFHKGHTKVYVSNIISVFFKDIRKKRFVRFALGLSIEDSEIYTSNHIALWASMGLGENFSGYGVFKEGESGAELERTRVWFKSFPMLVSLFSDATCNLVCKYDSQHSYTNTKAFFPDFDGIKELVSDINYTARSTVGSGNISNIFFVLSEQKFLALDTDGTLCDSWSAYGGYGASSAYNGSSRALSKVYWRSLEDNLLYRYKLTISSLESVSFGYGGHSGIFEVDPRIAFPAAKSVASYKQNPAAATGVDVFDYTFDFTFHTVLNGGNVPVVTNLIISDRQQGHYLRWIDNYGCLQYFLFDKGVEVNKNKLSGNGTNEEDPKGGTWFPNVSRPTNVEVEVVKKCCAVSLKQEIWNYVKSIIGSPVIDLYAGYSSDGEEIWIPVSIVASNHNYNPKDVLHDLEISFTMPLLTSQTL